MLDDGDVDGDSQHIGVVGFGEQLLDELRGEPEGLLFCELHDEEEVYDEVHALAVADEWVLDGEVPQNRAQS